ncbi:XRE family transcriptional regulator [Clostridium carboxidivorans P7]|uniref:Stage 0 sporulation protein A homolog n=1 Tax=Clostridium carboxidivorans P7 TaxID=536227 RepID=C6PQ36_9CLOT|nr:response regulator transcription factor [Clostridium carboxidivorans]AKN29642.1 XRE family transcriptional regulator [Clostridium carboxidivorans P7]EET88641.1 two component transcriptional regulator, winged helix family [Clostridium carboxidivorans P7]EFG89430.1 response regulator receiver domain protein [Clostridium carboxidivorans P7]
MNEKILLVDDEKSILDVVTYALKKEGYFVERAYDGREALDKVEVYKPHIVVLDLMLPVINGYDVCKRLEGKNIGIIMLTAKEDIVDKILGLELGADDYMTKPFDIRELIARIKSLIRRLDKTIDEEKDSGVINIGDLNINKKKRTVSIKNSLLEFTPMEFDLLYLLLSNSGTVYSREQILNIIWNMDYAGGTRTVDTHIQRIRKKLGNNYQDLIQTVYGIGYKGVDELIENGN